MSNDKPKVEQLAQELQSRKRITLFFQLFFMVIATPVIAIAGTFFLSETFNWFLSWHPALKLLVVGGMGLFIWIFVFVFYTSWNEERIEELEKLVGRKDKSDE